MYISNPFYPNVQFKNRSNVFARSHYQKNPSYSHSFWNVNHSGFDYSKWSQSFRKTVTAQLTGTSLKCTMELIRFMGKRYATSRSSDEGEKYSLAYGQFVYISAPFLTLPRIWNTISHGLLFKIWRIFEIVTHCYTRHGKHYNVLRISISE